MSSGFEQFELSAPTLKGLKDAGYDQPTEIQEQSLIVSLKGQDVLGAAKTGSGKTLAFVVPILELLFKETWTNLDGLGALVITPTRELAYQIFEVLKKVGKHHDFSAGLVIGGKDLKFEQSRLSKCHIIVCTPGRLLQHMDQNAYFSWDQLKIVVLDEADRILDLGFAKTMNAIIENLPPERQTLLFSATQTKSVKDLARLSLKDPKYVSVHENSSTTTPESLQQSYVVCELNEKLNTLWSFLKSHTKHKILVFMASCKQVKYTHEILSRLKPGLSVLALYGTLHQLKRMDIYDTFCRKQHGVLIATDIASRGLDFPDIDWVVQLDCPEDVNTYIHRAGRTARYTKGGEALLVLLPSEEKAMIENLTARKIPIEKIDVNERQMHSVERRAEAFCAMDVALKESAQRAFKAYIKNIFLMKDKNVFSHELLDHNSYARSLGLAVTPRVRFLEKVKGKSKKPTKAVAEGESLNNSVVKKTKEATLFNNDEDGSSDDEMFTVKSTWRPEASAAIDEEKISKQLEELKRASGRTDKLITKASMVKKLMKKKIKPNKKVVFNEDGEVAQDEFPREQTSEKLKELEKRNISGIDIELAKEIMKDEDKVDKKLFRKLVKEKHREQKRKEKEKRRKAKGDGTSSTAVLAGDNEDDEEEGYNQYLDALPDPSQYYSDNDDDEEEFYKGSDYESDEGPVKRRKLASSEESEEDEEEEAADMGLREQEELALHLLSNK